MSGESPRLLILETSGRSAHVAVALGDSLLARSRLDEARRHARDLAPAVLQLLHGQGWRARDLHGVIVSLGPGSYTGLRVGIISAKALCYALGCPLVGVETFAAIATQAPAEATRLDVLADAQRDKVYIQPFARSAAAGGREPCPTGIALAPAGESVATRAGTIPGGRTGRRVGAGADLPAAQFGGGAVAAPKGENPKSQ